MTLELLRKVCADNAIKTVALIDDVVDTPSPRDVDRTQYRAFRAAVGDAALQAEVKRSSVSEGGTPATLQELPDYEDLEEEDLAPYWQSLVNATLSGDQAARAILRPIERLFAGHVDAPLAMLETVSGITSLFAKDLGCEVEWFGRRPDSAKAAKKDLVLLDFFLEPGISVADAQKQTAEIVSEIRKHRKGQERHPSFVLISTKPKEVNSEEFRSRARLMRSRFRFIAKDDLRKGTGSHMLDLHDILEAQPKASEIENLLDDWLEAAKLAAEDVHAKVLDFDVFDFVYLDVYRLYKEGTSLGSYLRWLMTAYLQSMVPRHLDAGAWGRAETLRLMKKDPTGRADQDGLVKAFERPSLALDEAYASIVVDDTRANDGAFPAVPEWSDLAEGDVFVERERDGSDTTVLMVLTPTCDLTVRGGSKAPIAEAVLFLPGTLKALVPGSSKAGAEVIRVTRRGPDDSKSAYYIQWRLNEPRATSWVAIRGGHLREMARLGRVREPFFSDVRDRFAGKVTRAGWEAAPLSPAARDGSVLVKVTTGGRVTHHPLFSFAAADGFVWAFRVRMEKDEEKPLFHVSRSFLTRLESELAGPPIPDGADEGRLRDMAGSLDFKIALLQPGVAGMRTSGELGSVEIKQAAGKSTADILLVVKEPVG